MMGKGFERYVKELFNDQAFSDITIIVDDDKEKKTATETVSMPAHRLVLATMSDYFRTMLYGDFAEANQSEIRLFEMPRSTFQRCLRFMYCGWDATLNAMSLDEGIKFYSLARMLLMDGKLKASYSEWMVENVPKWERQLWTVFSTAVENDLPLVVERCVVYFSDIANEYLASDSMLTIPLPVIRKVLSCKKMNCSKDELLRAIKRWVKSNKIDTAVKKDLIKSVQSRKAQFFKGKQMKLYDRYMEQLRKQPQEIREFNGTSTEPTQHSYSSLMSFFECIWLVGVTIVLERNQISEPNQHIKGVIDLKVEIKPRWETVPTVSRTVVAAYDFTHRHANEMTIFFRKFKICGERDHSFTFSWTGEGVQPVLHMFGKTKNSSVSVDQSVVVCIYWTPASDDSNGVCDSCLGDSDGWF